MLNRSRSRKGILLISSVFILISTFFSPGKTLLYSSLVGSLVVAILYHYRPHYSDTNFANAENKLLTTHIKQNSWTLKDVSISNGQYIHTLIINEDKHDINKKNLVLVHGWSSGLALWGKNIDQLAKHYNIYAIDLLGFGRSGRPYYPKYSSPEHAKYFWVNSIREWKKEIFGDEKIVLLGHSLVFSFILHRKYE